MNTKHNRKTSVVTIVGAAIAAAAAPILSMIGAAPAQAGTFVSTVSDALGVTVHVQSVPGPGASSGLCSYTAIPNGPGVPAIGVPFYLQENNLHKMWFPGIQTGTTWDVTVDCANGFDSPTMNVVY